MIQEDIIQGNLYQNKHDKSLIILATKQEENSKDGFCGVNLSNGVYNYDWQLYQFEPCNFTIKENLLLKERIMELTEKCINQQRDFDQRFCDMYDQQQTKYTQKIKDVELLCFHYENQKKFIQHLQDYIAAKYLEENGLILEKFIQEENTNASKKESN